jgi:hypothetical protein
MDRPGPLQKDIRKCRCSRQSITSGQFLLKNVA